MSELGIHMTNFDFLFTILRSLNYFAIMEVIQDTINHRAMMPDCSFGSAAHTRDRFSQQKVLYV